MRSFLKSLCYYQHISSEVGGIEDWATMKIPVQSLCSPPGE